MTIQDFTQFYHAVHGKNPFPWQSRLAVAVENGGWPAVIALPTASGKTSALDIAIFCLALDANRPNRRAALRTFFVIDRRVVVDEAAEHAASIANALETSTQVIVREVADRLRSFGGGRPLEVVALRGGMYRDQNWADRPNQPLICVSTVDQVGSRLLFRGYQLSESQRPVHAALVGMDSLIILDEAHLSRAFGETISAVRKYQQWAETSPARGVSFVEMSATTTAQHCFKASEDDAVNPELHRRWSARKLVTFKEPSNFEDEAVLSAVGLRQDPHAKVVGIIVNRVRSARTIFETLQAKTKHQVILLTGRVRPYDRDRLLGEVIKRMGAGRDRSEDTPLFVVATQTVEVGANLDFDALVSEAAPLDALRQRFGRLDRLGTLGESRGVLLLRKGSTDGKDTIYGERLSETWRWLTARAEQNAGQIDFGITALNELAATADVSTLFSKGESAPLLFPAHVESWVQTNPAPAVDPDVAPFLHGPDALNTADVQIVWRADLDPDEPETWESIVIAAPPMTREAMSLPFIGAKKWLANEKASEVADIEGVLADSDQDRQSQARPFVLWMGAEHVNVTNKLSPGTTIIVPSAYGGCDEFGWVPESKQPVTDIGDACRNEAAAAGLKRYRVRLHEGVLFPTGNEGFRELLNEIRAAKEDNEPVAPLCDHLLEYLRVSLPNNGWIGSVIEFLKDVPLHSYCRDGYVLTARRKRTIAAAAQLGVRELRMDETDDDDSASFLGPVTLRKHTAGVVKTVRYFASRVGVAEEIATALESAAEFHDLGKCDERFQAMLHGGSLSRAMAASEPLAKSESPYDSTAQYRIARERAGYPKGARHEFTSVALVANSNLNSETAADLILYLVGSHHGYGRPVPPVSIDEAPVEVSAMINSQTVRVSSQHGLWRFDSGWLDRFWSLNQRFGYWGLAYIEMILRRADCVQSRSEQERV